MDRRTFLGALAGGLLAAPRAAEPAQAGTISRIGLLTPAPGPSPLFRAFREGLEALGYVEGRSVTNRISVRQRGRCGYGSNGSCMRTIRLPSGRGSKIASHTYIGTGGRILIVLTRVPSSPASLAWVPNRGRGRPSALASRGMRAVASWSRRRSR